MYQKYSLLKSIVFILFSLLFIRSVNAQCTSSSAHNPGTAASVSFTGSKFGFDVPNNALLADNVFASATAIFSVLSGPTQNLTLTNFGFSVPSGATICGVVAVVKKRAANVNTLATVFDNSVKLVKGGVVGGTNKALVGNWTTTNTAFTYGGDADLWGLALTPADVNASNFGIAFSANISGTVSLIPSAQLDNIQLTVYYTLSTLPVILSEFKAQADQDKVRLDWKTEREINFSHFEIERSEDGRLYKRLSSVFPSTLSNDYSFVDLVPADINFYRLKMIDTDGSFEYSPVASASPISRSDQIKLVRTDDGDGILYFKNCRPGKYICKVLTTAGQVTFSKEILVRNSLIVPIWLAGFPKGVYLVSIFSDVNCLVRSMKFINNQSAILNFRSSGVG